MCIRERKGRGREEGREGGRREGKEGRGKEDRREGGTKKGREGARVGTDGGRGRERGENGRSKGRKEGRRKGGRERGREEGGREISLEEVDDLLDKRSHLVTAIVGDDHFNSLRLLYPSSHEVATGELLGVRGWRVEG